MNNNMNNKKNSRLVYSTDQGRIKQDDTPDPSAKLGDGKVRVSRETKGRKGKGVTLISGFALTEGEIKTLGKTLKQLCGTGGTVKDGVIEIQGDQRDKIVAYLLEKGFDAKKAGG